VHDLTAPPRFPDIGVIALTDNFWHGKWQTRHQVLSRLAEYFHVAWVNPVHEWRDALAPRPEPTDLPPQPGFEVYSAPTWLPLFYRPAWLADATFRGRLRQARARLLRRGCRRIVLYVWKPVFARALDLVPHDLSCYHIDDEYAFTTEEVPLDPVEVGLMRRVDEVFIHSRGLWDRKGHINPHSTLTPNGVDYAAFATPTPEPEDLASIPRPRMGYTGWIKNQLDWELLESVATANPQWSFVFVGGTNRHPEILPYIERMSARPNVHFLGAKNTPELARYPQHFDVCMMPYAVNPYTNCIYPLKLHEYLASGRPAVGSPITALLDYDHVVTLASDTEAWSRALADALTAEAQGPARRAERQALARSHDWDELVQRLAAIVLERLGRPGRDARRVAEPAESLPPAGGASPAAGAAR
jgi:glycosyltransferase involved in cell wall biosynthesis